MSNRTRFIILAVVLVLIGASIWYLQSQKAHQSTAPLANDDVTPSTVHTSDYATKAAQYPPAQELVNPDGYINTAGQPITLSSLIGKKVILLDFWTYSCINCQRTLPYLNAWYQKYKDQGLEIIGVSTPEFDFEKQLANVQTAVQKFGIQYPVVLDNEYATWNAYHNEYWPEDYLIDINGLVVDQHIGEGDYDTTEKEIQSLLTERDTALGQPNTVPTSIVGITQTIDAQSPETYFGSDRNQYLANGTQSQAGSQTLTIPTTLTANQLYLGGTWNFQPQYAQNTSTDATIEFQYDAKDVYFVASAASNVSLTVLRDGQPIGVEHGADVDASGTATINAARLYNLVNEQTAGTHTLEIIVHNAGLQAFTFTFG